MTLSQSSFSWKNDSVLNGVFLAGTIYFILTTAYSLVCYQEKFMYDGHALLFHITNYKWFPNAAQREIFYLQQIIPVAFSMIGLKMKWVMLGYVFNVYLLYYLMFFMVVRKFKDAPAAILLMLIHYKGDPYNYFVMVEELLPGACFVIVLCSLLRNLSIFRSKAMAYAIGMFLMIFIVRSHPLAILCLAAAVSILFFSNREIFTENKKALLALGLAGVVFVALKFASLNPYDLDRMSQRKSVVDSITELLHPNNAMKMMFYLFFLRKVFTIVFSSALIYLVVSGKYVNLAITLLVTIMTIVVFNMMVHDNNFASWNLTQMKLDQWSLPVRFAVFVSFCFLVIPEIKTVQAFRFARAAFIFYFLIGALQMPELRGISQSHIAQAEKIIGQCRKEGVSKAVIHLDELSPLVPLHHNCFYDVLVISSLDSPDSCVQVVYAGEDYFPLLQQVSKEQIIIQRDGQLLQYDYLNSRYYNLPVVSYKEVRFMEEVDGDAISSANHHGKNRNHR